MKVSEIKDDRALLLLVSQCAEMMSASLYKSKELFVFWNDMQNEADSEVRRRIIKETSEGGSEA